MIDEQIRSKLPDEDNDLLATVEIRDAQGNLVHVPRIRSDAATDIRDGNDEIAAEMPLIVEIIARTSRWVHPETFRRLPVWCPWTARGRPLFDKTWQRRYTNTKRSTQQTVEKVEGNIAAGQALVAALGVRNPRPRNWTVCHIWGYDDPAFASQGSIVRDPRYFSCVANMIWLPTPLKGFTDALPEIKKMLRTCAYYLYGWVCEHESVTAQSQEIREGIIPDGYPKCWPAPGRQILPPGIASFSPAIEAEIRRRKAKFARMLGDMRLTNFPRDAVRDVLAFWKIEL